MSSSGKNKIIQLCLIAVGELFECATRHAGKQKDRFWLYDECLLSKTFSLLWTTMLHRKGRKRSQRHSLHL